MYTKILAEHAANAAYGSLPPDVVKKAKELILDHLGVAILGSTLPSSVLILKYVESIRGVQESTALGSRFKAPAAEAALANGASAHAPELDDTEHLGALHPGTTVIPAVLALAEKLHSSGEEFITAVTVGYDVAVRIALAVQGSTRAHYKRGFHPSATCGVFGAAAAVGALLRLDADRIANALGIAASESAGLMAYLNNGSWTKRFGVGNAARGGVVAATLASLGFTGPMDALEGNYGFLKAYSDAPDVAQLSRGLGLEYSVLNTGIKPYACCRYNQSAIDCALGLVEEHRFNPDEVTRVRVGLVKTAIDVLAEPKEIRYKPKTVVDAQFSVPYSVAVAILRRKAFIDEYSEEAIRDANVLDFARRVEIGHDQELDKEYPKHWPAWMEVELNDGRLLRKEVLTCKGDVANPLTTEELERKFIDLAKRVVTEGSVENLLRKLRRLEELDDASALLDDLEYLELPATEKLIRAPLSSP